jgi:Domain of unknown function (DUF4153)
MTAAEAEVDDRGRLVVALGLATGLAQGAVAYALAEAERQKVWPATQPQVYAAFTLICAYLPLIALAGYGRIRPVTLAIWAAVAAVVLALFATHNIATDSWNTGPTLTPAFEVFAFAAVILFVGHHLVGPADTERRLIATYPAYFDWAWKDAVQLWLSLAFLGAFWAALELGASLFQLIHIDALHDLIQKEWFAFPISGLVFAGAVQLTTARIGLVVGVRLVGLTLLSWLLPVLTVLVVTFLIALPVRGLGALFGSKAAGSILLSSAGGLIVLISAAYQDGARPHLNIVLRWSARVAGVALVPVTAVAGYALWLRVAQYGWTPARVEAAACTLIGSGYAAGYAIAAVWRTGAWLKRLEVANVVMAVVVMVVIACLFTSIADPARLAAADQVNRLAAGRIDPAHFDFNALNSDGRYGKDALKRLQAMHGGGRAQAISQAATRAIQQGPPALMFASEPTPEAMARWLVYPAGAALPPSFTNQDWSGPRSPIETNTGNVLSCLHIGAGCEGYVLDLRHDGRTEILVSRPMSATLPFEVLIYELGGDGRWRATGGVQNLCPREAGRLREGHVTLTPATGFDLQVGPKAHPIETDLTSCD